MTDYLVPVYTKFSWQDPVLDKDLTSPPGSPNKGDRYIVGSSSTGDWSSHDGDIAYYTGTVWAFINVTAGMLTYIVDESQVYIYTTSWSTLSSTADMTKSVYDTDNDGIVDAAETLEDDAGNIVTPTEILNNIYNTVLLAFRMAIEHSLSYFSLVGGYVDEYENENGINTSASIDQQYNSTNDYYSPATYSLTTSPYAQYKLNENVANTTVTDSGTGGNTGTASTNTSNLYNASGKINSCFDFDGSSEYVNIDSLGSAINSDTTGSFAAWINIDAIPSEQNAAIVYIGASGSPNGRYFGLFMDTNGYISAYMIGDVTPTVRRWLIKSSNTYSASSWIHIVVVQDGTLPKLYINGYEDTNATFENGYTGYTTWFSDAYSSFNLGRIGRFTGTAVDNWFDGRIDDLRYYSGKALTAGEVKALYNVGTGTEAAQPTSDIYDMTLISNIISADSVPDTIRVVIFEEDVDSVTLNTDYKTYGSRDGGTTYTQVTLSDEGNYESGKRVIVGSVDISGQPSGTSMVLKQVSENSKDLKIHGSALLWD